MTSIKKWYTASSK